MYTRCGECREGENRWKGPPEKTVVCSGMTRTEQGDVAVGEQLYTSTYIQKSGRLLSLRTAANTQREENQTRAEYRTCVCIGDTIQQGASVQ